MDVEPTKAWIEPSLDLTALRHQYLEKKKKNCVSYPALNMLKGILIGMGVAVQWPLH